MNLTKDLITRLENKIVETLLLAQKRYNRVFDIPTIEFGDMGNIAGKAFRYGNKVAFSPTLYSQNIETFLNRTVPHEVAHLVCFQVYPFAKQGHGPEWRSVMRNLEVADIGRCHSYDTTSVKKRIFKKFALDCRCGVGHIKVTAKIKNKIEKGVIYTCRTCKSVIGNPPKKTNYLYQ